MISKHCTLPVWNGVMNHPNTCWVWAGGSRMFCATYLTDLFAFIFWKSYLYIIIQLYVISMHLSASFPVESVFIIDSFHPSSTFPTPASYRGWRDFSQAHPCLDLKSDTAQCSSVCAALSLPDGIKNEACCSKQDINSVWPISQEPLSHLAEGFSPSPAVGAGSSCLQPAHLTSSTPFFSVMLAILSHSPHFLHPYPHNALTLWQQDFYGRAVPLTATI